MVIEISSSNHTVALHIVQLLLTKYCTTKPGLSPGFVMHKGIPIAIFRLRHKKTVRQYVLVVLEY